MKKVNQVLQFAQAQTAKTWRRFQLLPAREDLDLNNPPCYIVEAQGERGDGTVFAVQVAIGKKHFDLLPAQHALGVALSMADKAIQQLQTYTSCACKKGAPCETHRQTVH